MTINSLFPPVYVVKILQLDGTVITDNLPVTGVTFTKRLALPGQQNLGSFTLNLVPARGMNTHQAALYEQLDYFQRVEIYEFRVTGDPVFSGQIIDLPSDLQQDSLSGVEWLNRLTQRQLRHYEFPGGESARTFNADGSVTINTTIDEQIRHLLKTWQFGWKDNFNRGSVGSDWQLVSGSWTITLLNGYYRLRTTTANSELARPIGVSGDVADSFRCQADALAGLQANDWQRTFTVFETGAYPWTVTVSHTANEDFTTFTLSNGADDIQRMASYWELPPGEWFTVDIWVYNADGGAQYAELWLNGRQFLVLDVARQGYGGNFSLASAQANAYFDNAIVWVLEDEFAVSSLDATVGDDKSATIRFVEGKNLLSLSLNPTANSLATYLKFKGQNQDQNQRLAEALDFDACDRYGIIEEQMSDQRISSNRLARSKVENELVRRKDGQASLNATMVDTPLTLGQWGVGDEVWVTATRPDIARKVRVVEVTYTSGTPVREVTFDNFPRSRSGAVGQLMDDVEKINRGTKGNAANLSLTFQGGSLWVDDFDSRVSYIESDEATGVIWQSWTGGLANGAFKATLHGTSKVGGYCQLHFSGSGIAVYARKGPNLVGNDGTKMNIYIDGNLDDDPSLHNATNIDKQRVYTTSALTSAPHTIKLERAGTADLNIYIDIDAFRLLGHYWTFYLEGRAVNSALLSWTNTEAIIPVSLKINGIDRTAALGGPWTGDVNNLNVHPYLSAPGAYSVEFIHDWSAMPDPDNPDLTDPRIEATLTGKVLV